MKMSQQVANWNRRARQLGLQHDLTVVQWLENLEFFGYSCAYCGGSAETMDHYFPLAIQDDPLLTGTSAGNCLPCCWACNHRKGFLHPTYLSSFCEAGRLALIQRFVGQHAERKRTQAAINERFNRWWARRWLILTRFQQYAALQTAQGVREFS